MSWLSPMSALYAGLVAVPMLLLFYFLKLKRQEKVVASTLLWKRAVQDLQVNAPFQRMRRNILLLLQLIALILFLMALGGPVMELQSLKTERYVVMIDNSASMNAVDVKPSRLEEAKSQAKVFVESLTEKSFVSLSRKPVQVMVVAINDQAKIICNFTSDFQQLAGAIDQIKPGDGGTRLEQGLSLARAYCQGTGADVNGASSQQGAQLVLFSDGGVRDAQNLAVASGEMIFQSIGASTDNVAITAMKAKRSFEDAERVHVFAKLTNYNDAAVGTMLELSINGDVKAVKTVEVGAKTIDETDGSVLFGECSVDFEISSLGQGVIEVRLLREDSLAADNAAWAVISEPRDVQVLLVSDGNPVLASALNACRYLKLFTCSRDEFGKMDHAAMALSGEYDVIVLDGHDGRDIGGRGCYLVFGKPPGQTGVEVVAEQSGQVVIDYRPKHPVLNYVNLDNLFVTDCLKMNFPRDGEVLAEFDCGPAIGLVRRNNSTYLLAGFDVLDSNWPFEPGFVLFVYNAMSFLAESAGIAEKTELAVAEPVVLQGLEAGVEGVFNGPGYEAEKIIVTEGGKLRLPIMDRVGLYALEFDHSTPRTFAVNLLDETESDIAPKTELVLSGESVEANDTMVSRFNLPVWPYLVAAVLLLMCVEWFVYNSKIRI